MNKQHHDDLGAVGEFINKAGAGLSKLAFGIAALVAAFQTGNIIDRIAKVEKELAAVQKAVSQEYWEWAGNVLESQPILQTKNITPEQVIEAIKKNIQITDHLEMTPGSSTFSLKESIASKYAKEIANEQDIGKRRELLSRALQESQRSKDSGEPELQPMPSFHQ